MPALVGGGLALATIFGHGPAFEWSLWMSSENNLFVYRWLVNVLTVWNCQVWAPALAVIAAVGLAISGVWTSGFRAGRLPAVVVLGASLVGAGVASLPLTIAFVVAVVALGVAIALFIAAVVAAVSLLFAFLASTVD